MIPGSTPGLQRMPSAARAPLGLREGADVCVLGGPRPHEQRGPSSPLEGTLPREPCLVQSASF